MRRIWLTLPVLSLACVADPTGAHTDDSTGTEPTTAESGDSGTPAAAGYCVTFESDQGGDGVPEIIGVERYDELGRVVESEADQQADGDIDSVTTTTYPEERVVTETVADPEGEGTQSVTRYVVSTVQHELTIESTFDLEGDGALEFDLHPVKSSPAGDPLEQRQDVTGNSSTRFVHTYDAQRRRLVSEQDFAMDGDLDNRQTFTYDDVAHTMTLTGDAGADGTSDNVREITYDEQERRLLDRVDNPVDGVWDNVATYTYEGDRLATLVTQIPSAGYTSTTTYTYDEDERLVLTATEDSAGNQFERRLTVVDCPPAR